MLDGRHEFERRCHTWRAMDGIDRDSAAQLRISVDRGASTLVITLAGELDLSNVQALDETLDRELQDPPAQLVFDVSQLTFMDSAGIAAFVRARNHVGAVTLRKPSNIVRRVIVGTGLADILRMES
jgi:anti-anti-sigma factor